MGAVIAPPPLPQGPLLVVGLARPPAGAARFWMGRRSPPPAAAAGSVPRRRPRPLGRGRGARAARAGGDRGGNRLAPGGAGAQTAARGGRRDGARRGGWGGPR